MSRGPEALLAAWREQRAGFAPLFLEPILASAFAHLAPAVRPGARVLDLGSGEGHVAAAFRACGAEVFCLDVDPAVLGAARALRPTGAGIAGDVARLPFSGASFDVVFCFSVLQYADRAAALAEIRRVLRPGGRVAVAENLAGSPVALAYRAWRALFGIRYPDRLTPRRHLAWRDRQRWRSLFPDARFEAWCLTSTALLLAPAVYRATMDEPPGSPVRAWLGATRRLDAFLLRRCPWLRHAAWLFLMKG